MDSMIPDNDLDMQLKIIVISHCDTGGHRGKEATLATIQESFYWDPLRKDCDAFVAQCVHCLIYRAGEKIPRPLSSQMHATKPIEYIHFDYLPMGKSRDGFKYVLVLRDDLNGYLWLVQAEEADAENTARALHKWMNVLLRCLPGFQTKARNSKLPHEGIGRYLPRKAPLCYSLHPLGQWFC